MSELMHSPVWVLIAKTMLALIMTALGLLSLLVVVKAKQWRAVLGSMENECDMLRDMSMLQATVLRSQLAQMRQKMEDFEEPKEKNRLESAGILLKQAMPVVSMVLAKESNLLKLGFAGFKLARSAYDYFSKADKN